MLLDTSAWVEFFIGSAKGRAVQDQVESGDCCTAMVSLAELASWALRERKPVRTILDSTCALSQILPLGKDACELAGEIHASRKLAVPKWGMVDSLIFATALLYGQQVLTADTDFRGLEQAVLL